MDTGAVLGERRQLIRQAIVQGIFVVVVPCPVFVKITQDVERFRVPRGTREITLEDRCQRGRSEMKCTCMRRSSLEEAAQMISALWMTTSSLGTS